LERSFGGDAWQAVPTQETRKLHVISVYGNNVWVGGDGIRLEHSSDNGTTWQPLTLPAKHGANRAIIHIRFQSPTAGTIEGDDGTLWKTGDGGKSWEQDLGFGLRRSARHFVFNVKRLKRRADEVFLCDDLPCLR
jgi:photosystem II stability/assembly factor-like uncharacterized protein